MNSVEPGLLKNRIAQVDAILSKAKRMLESAATYEKAGNSISARILKRRARTASKMAMKRMGILVIGYGAEMLPQIALARKIFLETPAEIAVKAPAKPVAKKPSAGMM